MFGCTWQLLDGPTARCSRAAPPTRPLWGEAQAERFERPRGKETKKCTASAGHATSCYMMKWRYFPLYIFPSCWHTSENTIISDWFLEGILNTPWHPREELLKQSVGSHRHTIDGSPPSGLGGSPAVLVATDVAARGGGSRCIQKLWWK